MSGGELSMNDPVIDVFRTEILIKLIEFFQPEDGILFGSQVRSFLS